MSMDSFINVTVSDPCAICGKPDWCIIARDRTVAGCRRETGDGHFKTDRGVHYHRLADRPDWERQPTRRPAKPARKAGPPTDWPALAERYARALTPDLRARLAVSLGLTPDGLDRFPLVGLRADDPDGACTTWPETDAAGSVVGINRRWAPGTGPVDPSTGEAQGKRMIAGGKRGLTFAHDLDLTTAERLFVVEGPTCCAAMTLAGLPCVGRFSVNGGAELLAEFVHLRRFRGTVLIVGENDRKPDGRWPGRDDARAFAARLAGLLRRDVLFALPPESAKDSRDYLTGEQWGAP